MLGFAGSAQPTYLITALLKITQILAAKIRLSQSRKARKARKVFNKTLTVINVYESQNRHYTLQSNYLPFIAFPFASLAALRENRHTISAIFITLE